MENNIIYWDPSRPFSMSAQQDQINTALSNAVPAIPGVAKSSKGNYGMYAPLDDILKAIASPLENNQLTIDQWPSGDGWLVTRLGHSSGQWIMSGLKFPDESGGRLSKQHALGGNITYFKRYCIAAILRISNEEDTDGYNPKENTTPITTEQYDKLAEALATKPNPLAIMADVKKREKIDDLKKLTQSAYEALMESLL